MTAKDFLDKHGIQNRIVEGLKTPFNEGRGYRKDLVGLIEDAIEVVKNCSALDAVQQSEQFTPKQLYMLAQKHSIQDFQKILKEAHTWKG